MGLRHHLPYSTIISRRGFVRWCGVPLAAGMGTRVRADLLGAFPGREPLEGCAEPWGTEYRLTPHYRAQSPFDEVIRQTEAGHDAYISELYAEEVSAVLAGWSVVLQQSPPDVGAIVRTLSPGLTATPLRPEAEVPLRHDLGLQVWRGRFTAELTLRREPFVQELDSFFAHTWRLRTAEFEVASLVIKQESPVIFVTGVRYDLVGPSFQDDCDERLGRWELEWEKDSSGRLAVRTWRALLWPITIATDGSTFIFVCTATTKVSTNTDIPHPTMMPAMVRLIFSCGTIAMERSAT
jgi:hypothetical protein